MFSSGLVGGLKSIHNLLRGRIKKKVWEKVIRKLSVDDGYNVAKSINESKRVFSQ